MSINKNEPNKHLSHFNSETTSNAKNQNRTDDASFSSHESIILNPDVINAFNEAMYILNTEGGIVQLNNSAEQMNGYSRDESIGNAFLFLSAPGRNNDTLIQENIFKSFKENKQFTVEYWTRHKSGKVFLLEVMFTKAKYLGNDALIAVCKNNSAIKGVGENLSESEIGYRNLYDNSPIGIYRTTPDGKIILANNTLIKMFGYNSFEEIANQNLETNFFTKGYSREEFKDKIEINGEVNGFELALSRKDGTPVWVRENARVYKDDAGNVIYYEGTLEDISERKLAEEALRDERLLFIGGPVIIIKWKIDPQTYNIQNSHNNISIEYISPNVSQALGYTQEELTNNMLQFYSLIHPNDVERISREARIFVAGGESWYQQEYRIRDKSGKYRWYFDFTRIIRNSEGQIVNYHGYLFDISDRKEAEEALVRSEKQLRELNTMKDKFFSVIAHDLRSPFQGLLGMASILADDEFELDETERKEFTKKLHEGLKTQFALLDNLLTWSRLQRGVVEFVPSFNDLTGDILETCAILNNSFEKKRIKLVTELPSRLIAFYDKNMIATVLRNLLSNAVKFTKEEGTITVTSNETSEEIRICIKDTGVGIQQENILKLFRIDTMFSMRGTNDEGGTGLGLILCKEFIEKHSGKIWAESQFEKGSTFYFTIPKKSEVK